jgi:ABC-2 type transport system permease protein
MTAPVSRAAIERAKIAAIGQPIALIVALPLAALAFASPWAGFCALLFGSGAVASSALVNLWRQTPSRRGLVLRRHSQSKLVGMMEHLVSILWAVATTTAVIGSWATIVPLAAVAGVLAINRRWAATATSARRLGRLTLPASNRTTCR